MCMFCVTVWNGNDVKIFIDKFGWLEMALWGRLAVVMMMMMMVEKNIFLTANAFILGGNKGA